MLIWADEEVPVTVRLRAVRQLSQTFLQNAYGANHANAVLAILQNAPAHIRALWEQYAVQFRATNMRRDEGAFYSPRDDSVHLHIPSVARGDAISTPYSVLFHEYGHMTDYLIARTHNQGNYSAYSDLFQGIGSDGKAIIPQRIFRRLAWQNCKG